MRSLPDIYGDGTWRKVRVNVNTTEKRVCVVYQGITVIDWVGDLNTKFNAIGFGAATAAIFVEQAMARHAVRNVIIRDLDKTNRPQ